MGKIRKNYLCVFIFLIVSQRATNIIDGFSYGNEDIRIYLGFLCSTNINKYGSGFT